jgi:hypothetical protein
MATSLVPTSLLNRKEIVCRLERVAIYETTSVIQNWTIPFGNSAIKGNQGKGKVALSPTDRGLHIFMMSEDIVSACPPYELAENLAQFCGIEKEEHISLLQFILCQDNHQKIEEVFRRKGISKGEEGMESDNEGKIILVAQFICDKLPQLTIQEQIICRLCYQDAASIPHTL